MSLHPICKIEIHLRPESLLSIRKYASYNRQPLSRRVVGQYIELETLPYLNFRFHSNSSDMFAELRLIETGDCTQNVCAPTYRPTNASWIGNIMRRVPRQLLKSGVAVEKLDLSENRPKKNDQ